LRYYRKEGGRVGRCLLSIGDTFRMTGNFSHACDAYSEAISVSRLRRDNLLRADATVGLGLSRRALGEWEEALKLFSRANETYLRKSDKEGIAFTFWAMGGAFRVGGEIRNAIDSFKKAKRIYESLPEERAVSSSIGYCLCGLGGAYRIYGRFEDSLRFYTKAQRLFTSVNDRFGTAYSHCGTGNALRMQGDLTGAMEYLKKAEKLYKGMGDIVSYSYTLWSMGMVRVIEGGLQKAEVCFRKAGAGFRKTNDLRGTSYHMLGMGELLFLRGDVRGAKRSLRRALEISVRHGFKVELCHAKALLGFIDHGQVTSAHYREIGLWLKFTRPPLNIP
jgi:tetratricopeptide (TPR) repeat protein